jgi:hypothetical protein
MNGKIEQTVKKMQGTTFKKIFYHYEKINLLTIIEDEIQLFILTKAY